MSFGVWIEDEELFAIEKTIDKAIRRDDLQLFLNATEQLRTNSDNTLVRGQEFLMKACEYRAYKCATALLDRKTDFLFNVNRPTHSGYFPIHHAAIKSDPGMIELLLHHGGEANVRAAFVYEDKTQYLPLHGVLNQISYYFGDYEWKPKASIYQIITLLCLQRCRRGLECVELLSWKTPEVGSEFLHYAKEGNFLFLAALLAVARKWLGPSIEHICLALSSHGRFLEDLSNDEKGKLSLLLDVFERAGEEIEAYIKKKKWGVTVREISNHVADLLHVNQIETDLLSFYRSGRCSTESFKDGDLVDRVFTTEDEDAGMKHHGKSGHRWRKYEEHGCEPDELPKQWFLVRGTCQIPTEVDVIKPLAIPCFINCNFTAAKYMKNYKDMHEAVEKETASERKRM